MEYFLAHFDFKQRRPKTIYFRVKEREPLKACFEVNPSPTVYLKPSSTGGSLKLFYGLFIISGGEFPKIIWIPTDEEGVSGEFPMGPLEKVHIEDLLNGTYLVYQEFNDLD